MKEKIGISGLTIHYISSVLGVGILILPGAVYSVSGVNSILAWTLLILISWPFARAFAEISIIKPTSSGIVDIVKEAFNDKLSKMVGIFLLITLIIANPLLGIASGRFILQALSLDTSSNLLYLSGLLVILSTAILNSFGLRVTIFIQGTILSLLTISILAICISSFFIIPNNEVEMINYSDFSLDLVLQGMLIAFFGFIGWENAAPVADSVDNPRITYTKAINLGVIIVGGLYILMSIVVMINYHLIDGSSDGGLTFFTNLISLMFGSQYSIYSSLIAATLMFLTMNAWMLGTSKFSAGLATNLQMGKLTPKSAIWFIFFSYSVVILFLYVISGTEITLIKISSGAFLLFFIISLLAITVLSKKRTSNVINLSLVVALTLIFIYSIESALIALFLLFISFIVANLIDRRNADANIS